MKNSKIFWIVILIFLLGILIFMLTAGTDEERVCFSQICLDVKVADSQNERAKGLMFVEKMDENEGMLFVFDYSDKHYFWMKNTLIPLDIIWIDEDFTIVHIENAVPCVEKNCPSYFPEKKAKYVLEVNSGWAERNGIKIGEKINLEK